MSPARQATAARWFSVAAALLACALSVPPWRSSIEQSMVWHMVVQMPLLVAAGWVFATHLPASGRPHGAHAWNRYGLTGLIASQFVMAYWMLPLAIDAAVVLPLHDAFKLASLLLCGAVLGRSFGHAPAVLQLFFVGYAVSMLVSAGSYMATTDRRLCNVYSIDSQLDAGRGLVLLGGALASAWAWRIWHASKHASKLSRAGRASARHTDEPIFPDTTANRGGTDDNRLQQLP